MSVLIALSISACTSRGPIRGIAAPVAPPDYAAIKAGDHVEVEMRDGRRERFRVHSVETDVLVSPSGHRYARAEMVSLDRLQFSHAKTWPLVAGGIVGGVILVAGILFAIHGTL